MELAIIFVVLTIIGVFIWSSYRSTRNRDSHKHHPGGNPNPNAPTSSRRL